MGHLVDSLQVLILPLATFFCPSNGVPLTNQCNEMMEMFGTGKEYCVIDMSYTYEDGMPVWPFQNFKNPHFKLINELGKLMQSESEEYWYPFFGLSEFT